VEYSKSNRRQAHAISFVYYRSKEKLKSSLGNSDGDDEELAKDAHHEEPREINYTLMTTNQIF
jgi:hypothetical protein